MPQPFVTGVRPSRAIEGGRISLLGDFGPADSLADVRVDGRAARTVFASSNRLSFIVPSGISDGGPVSISLNDVAIPNVGIEVGATIATGLHQVDNPLIDPAGNVYLTYSGTRGQQVPVSIFRIAPNGVQRNIFLRCGESDLDGDGFGRAAVRLQPIRGCGVPDRRRRER